MRETIERLKRLQDIDNEISEIVSAREEVSGKIERLHRVLEVGAAEQEERAQKLAEAERFCRDANAELQRAREHLNRLQARLGSLSKQKEFNAAAREIESQKQASKQKEEEIAKLSAEIDRYREAFGQKEASIETMRGEVAAEEQRRGEELARLTAAIEDVSKRRSEVERDLEPRLVQRYKRVSKARVGVAVVEVQEGKCMGCNRQVPPQLRIILLKGGTLETCPACSRFIYVPDDEVARAHEQANGAANDA